MSHHVTTIEGGMVMTDNEDFAEMARALRVFGWIRDLKRKEEIASKYSFIDKRFLFTTAGYNLRPTEISGAFGIQQMKKLEHSLKVRSDNARYWNKELSEFSDYLILPKEKPGTRHAWFGYPITIKQEAPFSREDLTKFMEEKKIETRPIMAGNIAEQPAMREIQHRVVGDLKNSKMIMRRSMFWGNHQLIGKEQREYVAESVREFMEKY
jgi:CDP-6-deoxy-D-xylo-4-hexulose-3-dehydrase